MRHEIEWGIGMPENIYSINADNVRLNETIPSIAEFISTQYKQNQTNVIISINGFHFQLNTRTGDIPQRDKRVTQTIGAVTEPLKDFLKETYIQLIERALAMAARQHFLKENISALNDPVLNKLIPSDSANEFIVSKALTRIMLEVSLPHISIFSHIGLFNKRVTGQQNRLYAALKFSRKDNVDAIKTYQDIELIGAALSVKLTPPHAAIKQQR